MFLSLKSVIFVVSSFFIVSYVEADKTYELQLHKYLVANLRPEKGILKQDLKKGIDKYSFKYPINSTSKDGIDIDLAYKGGYKYTGVYICRNEKMDFFKELDRQVFYNGFTGGKCPFKKDKDMQLKDKFSFKIKSKQDLTGTILMSIYVEYWETFERSVRYDVIGTAKAI
ncbi:uncharacterized protein LOC122512921 [Leptopilina heterotoma]|uniref:uncharacterized protein LOC122512921 n=1 Tax=Leptopilina heterotoma TaxID=63436 RepID=UPI001CA9FCB7|nr:uncharacterized protein LOC122512921 [Leptopilina heterotoma]